MKSQRSSGFLLTSLTTSSQHSKLPGEALLGDRFLYSGGTDSFQKFTAEISASEPVLYKNPSPIGKIFCAPLGLWKGSECPCHFFPSSGGGV